MYATIAELTVKRDNLSARAGTLSPARRLGLIERGAALGITGPCALRSISRSSIHYPPRGRESMENLGSMRRIDAVLLQPALHATNTLENLNSAFERCTCNVKPWRGGQMLQCWVASARAETGMGSGAFRATWICAIWSRPGLVWLHSKAASSRSHIPGRKGVHWLAANPTANGTTPEMRTVEVSRQHPTN